MKSSRQTAKLRCVGVLSSVLGGVAWTPTWSSDWITPITPKYMNDRDHIAALKRYLEEWGIPKCVKPQRQTFIFQPLLMTEDRKTTHVSRYHLTCQQVSFSSAGWHVPSPGSLGFCQACNTSVILQRVLTSRSQRNTAICLIKAVHVAWKETKVWE